MSETKYYPLTTSQQILMFADQVSLIHSWLNIASVVDFQAEINEKKMLEAIAITLMRSPSAAVRLHKNADKTLAQYFSDALPTGIELVDLSHLSDEEVDQVLTKWAKIPFPHKALDTQLVNFKLVRRSSGLCSLFLSVYHMSFDAYTVSSTVKDILMTYDALCHGTALPKEAYSPVPLFEAEAAYYASERYQRDREFWKNYFPKDDEPYFTSLYGVNDKHRSKGKRYGVKNILFKNKSFHENLRLDAALVNRINEQAAAWRVSPQSFFHLAMCTYLSVLNETNDVTVSNAVARRATLVQKRAGGTMVNPVAIRSRIDRSTTTFADAIQTAYHDINTVYRHADFMFGEVCAIWGEQYGCPRQCGYDAVTLCYQPYFTIGKDTIPVTFRRLDNGGSVTDCYLTIMPRDNSGDLWCNYECIKGYYRPEQVRTFHEFMVKFLNIALDNPNEILAKLASSVM